MIVDPCSYKVFAFIQAQPKVLERILGHLEVPAFVDLLVRIMQLDEHTECTGVVEVSNIGCISGVYLDSC